MLDPAEVVSDIPIIRLQLALHVFATLDVRAVDGLLASSDVGADRAAGNRAADGSYVFSVSATDLMPEHAADDRADDRAGNVDPATFFMGLAGFHPASLLGRTNDGTYRAHRHLVQSLNGSGAISRRSGHYRPRSVQRWRRTVDRRRCLVVTRDAVDGSDR